MAKEKKSPVTFMLEDERMAYLEKVAAHYSQLYNLEVTYRDLIQAAVKSHLPMPGETPRDPQGPFTDEQLGVAPEDYDSLDD